jgi:superfamily II DNA/RNA helicase
VHRIGRTGRAGATGEAISLIDPAEEKYLADIERMLKKKIEILTLDGFDPARVDRAAPRERKTERPAAERRGERTATPRAASGRSPDAARRPDREERDLAYAKNPDQPLPRAAEKAHKPAGSSALTEGGRPAHGGFGAKRPIPALLMKRKAPEPEKV